LKVTAITGDPSSEDIFTSREQSYSGQLPHPMKKPPPCTNTRTGSFDVDEAFSGTVMLRLRPSRSDTDLSVKGRGCWISPCSISTASGGDRTAGLSIVNGSDLGMKEACKWSLTQVLWHLYCLSNLPLWLLRSGLQEYHI